MAKKVVNLVRLQIPADQPDGGPAAARALGRHGINVAAFRRAFGVARPADSGCALSLIVTIYEDASFSMVVEPRRDAECRASAVAI